MHITRHTCNLLKFWALKENKQTWHLDAPVSFNLIKMKCTYPIKVRVIYLWTQET